MNRKKVSRLEHGLYRIFWKVGGSSLAAVGSTSNGDKWMAPTNWTLVGPTYRYHWREVKSARLLIKEVKQP